MASRIRSRTRFYRTDPGLAQAGRALVSAALRKFRGAGLTADRLALTLLLPDGRAETPLGFSHRGSRPIYPASVVKLFYLVAAEAWLARGRLKPGRELDRALAAMIRQSSNDATNHVVDLLTGTTGGPALPPATFRRWLRRRHAVNRYFAGWRWPEFAAINVCQKTWEEGPYGRERQSRVAVRNNRNRLTTDAVARLLWAIDRGEAVSAPASRAMRRRLARNPDPRHLARHPDNQIAGFFGEGLPAGARLWSKAGWTSKTRHDAGIVRLADGTRLVLVVFTEGEMQAANKRLLPFLARRASALVSRSRRRSAHG